MNYILLDFDGYVAKSYYASISKEKEGNDGPLDILNNLTESAIERAKLFFNSEDRDLIVCKIMSGHSFKKDIFPGYKNNRKADEEFGLFRDYVKENVKDVIVAENLEADDLITFMNAYTGYEAIVFSDDKDLRKYNPICGRINPGEDILETFGDMSPEQLIQMITGDSIDNIKGIPRKGEVWARKYLDKNGYTLDNVIRAYKENNVDIDECFKNLLEVIPISPEFVSEDYSEWCEKAYLQFIMDGKWDYTTTMKIIEGFMRYINKKVKEVYNNDSKSEEAVQEGAS